jgi:hypothetical protein
MKNSEMWYEDFGWWIKNVVIIQTQNTQKYTDCYSDLSLSIEDWSLGLTMMNDVETYSDSHDDDGMVKISEKHQINIREKGGVEISLN